MYILALETTGSCGSAAVADDNGRVVSASSSNEMNHLKDIIELSREAISSAGIDKKDITHIAAGVGPGSFTGIRIGVTVARTAAQMLGLPCTGISSLEAMAERVRKYAADNGAEYIAAIINARRHQTYGGVWRLEEGRLEPVFEQKQYIIEDLLSSMLSSCRGSILFTGDGTDAYGDVISAATGEGADILLAPADIRYQHAAETALLGLRAVREGRTVPYTELLPNYMRLSEAEQRLREGSLSSKIKCVKQ